MNNNVKVNVNRQLIVIIAIILIVLIGVGIFFLLNPAKPNQGGNNNGNNSNSNIAYDDPIVKGGLDTINKIIEIDNLRKSFDVNDLTNQELLRVGALTVLKDKSDVTLDEIKQITEKYFNKEVWGESINELYWGEPCSFPALVYNDQTNSYSVPDNCIGEIRKLNTVSKFVSANYDEESKQLTITLAHAYSAPSFYDTIYYKAIENIDDDSAKVFEIAFNPEVDDESKIDPKKELENVSIDNLKNVKYVFEINDDNYILVKYEY